MRFDFFTLGGRFFWEDIFYYQGWRIQRKINTKTYRLLDSHDIRREEGAFEVCKDTLLKYISACEIPTPPKDITIIIHGFARTKKSVKKLKDTMYKKNINAVIFNYCSLSTDLKHSAETLFSFVKNLPDSSNVYFVTIGAGCLLLRKLFEICDNYRLLNIKGIVNINPINSGSDFAFLLSRASFIRKILGPMLLNITPSESMRLTKIPQDMPLFLIISPSKISVFFKHMFSRLESFPQLSPPAEATYSPNIKEMQTHTWFPMNNENMRISCVEILKDLMHQ